ncbi:GNAT family N-acetyltransferase [Atopobium sp. oral taxon 810]|uniref:GNAT family N-acetyltransferase n=1 Tax=Atopobium sp. oral taxon 810 TaxID=712158 RepID=UPI000398252F|nr:GNAT family N-acetyltransferase [Atopobium sp. oral taxon 810]ERI03835.1 acetyltransferase, GNAT family [Atopobium sp. oral taxon 810 str. F0209]
MSKNDEESSPSLRVATIADAQELLAVYDPYVRKTAITFEWETPSLIEFRQRIKQTLQRYPYLVAECDGSILGYAYTNPVGSRAAFAWCAETSVYLREDVRGRGIGHLLYAALECLSAAQGLTRLYARVACTEQVDSYVTDDSLLFHHKMGYEQVGLMKACGYKFDCWYDLAILEKRLSNSKFAQEFIPFPQLSAEILSSCGVYQSSCE